MKKCKNILLFAGLATFLAIGCGEKPAAHHEQQQHEGQNKTDANTDNNEQKPNKDPNGNENNNKPCTLADQYCNKNDRNGMQCRDGNWVKWTCEEGTTCSRGDNGYLSCVTDSATEECNIADGTVGSVKDYHDNNREYKTVVINCREWMAENYQNDSVDYRCPFNNCSEENKARLGLLYAKESATSSNFCPSGWRLPTKAEFEALLAYIGSDNYEKSKNLRDATWRDGANKYGFSALPAGYYYSDTDNYFLCNSCAYFLSKTEATTNKMFGMMIHMDNLNNVAAGVFSFSKYDGLSVRCIKD